MANMSSIQDILTGGATTFCAGPNPRISRSELVLLCGSFNPLHDGHREMTRVAECRLARPVHFELSISNVDKVALDELQCRARLAQFDSAQTVWLTRATTFPAKAQLFPRSTFIVGTDTILRVADSAYYGHDELRRDRAIRNLGESGCRFLVFGRQVGPQFRVLSDLVLPRIVMDLCQEVSEDDFRLDLCSTDLRK